MSRDSASPAAAGHEVFAAPLLAGCLGRLESGERLEVLDLGPPRAGNVDYLSRYRCRLGIADALAELPALGAADAAGSPDIEAILPESLFAGAQLVLCWDVLDYLPEQGIRMLGNHLRNLARPGTELHALVAYGTSRVATRPTGYELVADGLRRPPSGADDPGRTPRRISSGELQRLLPDWQLERSVLLRNGLQEYLFRV